MRENDLRVQMQVGFMIQAESDPQRRDEYLQKLMELPNQVLLMGWHYTHAGECAGFLKGSLQKFFHVEWWRVVLLSLNRLEVHFFMEILVNKMK